MRTAIEHPKATAGDRRLRWVKTDTTPEQRIRWSRITGINEAYLYQCLTNRRDMNPANALLAEILTNGELTRKQLCQETWAGIWPELGDA